MATKPKKVTYRDPADDNADYLVPVRYDLPNRTKSVPRGGYLGSIYLPISLLLYVGVPISQFVIGLIYVGRCTIRQFISPYMILSGAFGIAFVIVGLIIFMQVTKQSSLSYESPRPNPMILKILFPTFIFLFLFVIGWFIAGQVIVFEVKLDVEFFDPVLPEYCHGNLYKAAYILIFVDYLLALIAIILFALNRVSPPETADTKKTKRPVRNTRK
ncbi:unnamed protein product [Adineta steineri]|uniref:Uncharacterized protein n=1 Tax=Adineta steineri TaxID=433720 RepID=A0A815NW01_9BILA|nr:unnamed protein product [Adineta steineri]CAF1439303.1 unnamed protein product [Adineta steineri]CAF1439678.1 unnamed protein product [Adineta steineri]CAF1465257.1 unnamed protein product [Adineta steineri]CAF1627112.1 unnamed protein product [Adineta steineri]